LAKTWHQLSPHRSQNIFAYLNDTAFFMKIL
jgi:hypothetical protein